MFGLFLREIPSVAELGIRVLNLRKTHSVYERSVFLCFLTNVEFMLALVELTVPPNP